MKFRASIEPWMHQQLTGAGIINRHVAVLNSNILNIPIVKCFKTVGGDLRDAVVLSTSRVLAGKQKWQQPLKYNVAVSSNLLLSDLQVSTFPRCYTGNLIVAIHLEWRFESNQQTKRESTWTASKLVVLNFPRLFHDSTYLKEYSNKFIKECYILLIDINKDKI